MLMEYRAFDNRPDTGHPLEIIIGRLMVDIARGESLVRQRSMILSLSDNRESLAHRRLMLEHRAANFIADLFNLAQIHGLDPLDHIHGEEFELVRLAVAPLSRRRATT